ncbi:MAG: TlpA disulfide reductase family protein [Bryobacteraceae bacterium]
MRRVILLAALPLAAQTPDEILAKVSKSYGSLKAVHIVASVETIVGGRGAGVSEAEVEYAGVGAGKVRAWRKSDGALMISNGDMTWKALGSKKEYMSLETAAAGGEDEEEDPDDRRKDFAMVVRSDLFGQINSAIRDLRFASLGKEEQYKLGSKKLRCWVLRGRAQGRFPHEFWIDQESGAIVLHKLKATVEQDGARFTVDRTMKVKLFERDAAVSDDLFTLKPPSNWKQVEMLELPGEDRTLMVNQRAADFTLENLEGQKVQLADLKGKVVVLDFWATWCPPCRKEMRSLEKLYKELPAESFAFLSVSHEDESTIRKFAKNSEYSLPMFVDKGGKVSRRYAIRYFPTLFVLDRDGVVRQHLFGGRSEAQLREAILSAAK